MSADRGLKHILFVDDEPHVLDGLRDALRRWRREWRMTFALGGPAALKALEGEPLDAVVCDIRMPEIDGTEVLAAVQRRHPRAVRVVLSGQAERADAARAAALAHRFLSKPCDVDRLTDALTRSLALQEAGRAVELYGAAAGVSHLPSPPRVYAELLEMLQGGGATPEAAAEVVARDVALAAKVLQLANAAFFGCGRSVTDLGEAVADLGLETLRVLVLSAAAFDELRPDVAIDGFAIERLQTHSSAVARLAGEMVGDDGPRGRACAAGLLHDVGQLVLAVQEPGYLREVVATARATGRTIVEVERERRAVTHADVGAHLLAVWGLPHEIVEAVAHHHDLRRASVTEFGSVAAVHVASALIAERDADGHGVTASEPDMDCLRELGVEERLAGWRALAARRQLAESAPA